MYIDCAVVKIYAAVADRHVITRRRLPPELRTSRTKKTSRYVLLCGDDFEISVDSKLIPKF